jgi:hypothetical protein
MPPRILYIAGYSRSGSTLVDMVLNSSARIASTGELTYLHQEATRPGASVHLRGSLRATARATASWLAARPTGRRSMVVARWNAQASAKARRRHGRGGRRARLPRLWPKPFRPHREGNRCRYHRRQLQIRARRGGAAPRAQPCGRSRRQDPAPDARSRAAPCNPMWSAGRTGCWKATARKPLETWRPIPGWVLANRIARRWGP